MHKVYLLLRNNKQLGPFSLEELMEYSLKPYDLIWVEGKSAGWRYPSEIDALKPLVTESSSYASKIEARPVTSPYAPPARGIPEQNPASTRIAGKHIYVSMPGRAGHTDSKPESTNPETDLQKKAEELRERTFAAMTEKSNVPKKEISTGYSRSLQEMEEEYTSWVYKQKTKKKGSLAKKQVLAILSMGLLITGVYFVATHFLSSRGDARRNEEEARQLPSKPLQTGQGQLSTNPVSEQIVTSSSLPTQTPPLPAPTNGGQSQQGHEGSRHPKNQQNQKIINNISVPEAGITKNHVDENYEERPRSNDSELNIKAKTTTAGSPVEEQPEKKKRGLFAGLFSKFKHKKEETTDNTEAPQVPSTRSSGNSSERIATHRGDMPVKESQTNQTAAANIDPLVLADNLDISTNERSEDWMMGVNGLKVTVHNKNSIGIKKATVEILYYDENNRLLDKRTVYFSNIPAKGNATVQAPEQRFADHVDYRLASISAL